MRPSVRDHQHRENSGVEAVRLAMALLLTASLEAAGGAALLPLAYDLALAAAVAMVLPGVSPVLLLALEVRG